MLSKKQIFGKTIEELVCSYLEKYGLELVRSNYRSVFGEIDLIMFDDREIVFVEVRYRRNERFGGSISSVDKKKQNKIIKSAICYMKEFGIWGKNCCRFDVVVVQNNDEKCNEINWIKNAFYAEGY